MTVPLDHNRSRFGIESLGEVGVGVRAQKATGSLLPVRTMFDEAHVLGTDVDNLGAAGGRQPR